MKIWPLLVLTMFVSCSMRRPTRFVPKQAGDYGYSFQSDESDPESKVAIFAGNADTSSGAAFSYSFFAAIQNCRERNLLATVSTPQDFSGKSTYSQLNSYNYKIGNQNYTNFYSTPVTLHFPKFATAFMCTKHARGLVGVQSTETLSRELVHAYTQDFKGAVMVKVSPGVKTSFKSDDVLISIDGQRVEDWKSLRDILDELTTSFPKAIIIRDKKKMTIKVTVLDSTKSRENALQEVVLKLCETLEVDERPGLCGKQVVEENYDDKKSKINSGNMYIQSP